MSWLTPVWSLPVAVAVLVAATAAITVAGSKLVGVVDRLADRTGMGEALAGALFLAAATSLAGLVVSVVAAASANASLAVSNSIGGIAVQTAFLVVADLTYRRVNIEHAAASLSNMFMAFLMILLLAVVAVGMTTPDWTVFGIHPATVVLVTSYLYGMRLSRRVGSEAMWEPRQTSETRPDVPDEDAQAARLGPLLLSFAGLASAVTVCGWAIGRSGLSVIAATGFDGTVVGAFVTSTSTSAPEMVTTFAAVRAGALTLAVAGIVGGNTFDTLFVATADVVFRDGSLYAAADLGDVFVVAWAMVLTALLGAGLLVRERRGVGFEGVAILSVYALGLVTVVAMS